MTLAVDNLLYGTLNFSVTGLYIAYLSKWDKKGNTKMLMIQILFQEFLIHSVVVCVEEKNFENFSQLQLQQFHLGITTLKSVKLQQYDPELVSGKSSMSKSIGFSSLTEEIPLCCVSALSEKESQVITLPFLSFLLILRIIYSEVNLLVSTHCSYLFPLHVQ